MEQVEIWNFKNIVHGSIGFKNTHKPYKASVLGLYALRTVPGKQH